MKKWEDFESFGPVIDKYMPEIGEGETMASQIVTAVNRIGYRWFNDGDTVSGDIDPKGDGPSFSPGEVSQFGNWLDKNVPEASAVFASWIDALESFDCDVAMYNDFLYELFETLLDEKLLEKYQDKPLADSIYDSKTYADNGIFSAPPLDDDGEEYENGMEEDDW